VGHGRKTNHVRGDGSFPRKRERIVLEQIPFDFTHSLRA